MDQNQIFVLALANVPTMLAVLIGILINNARLGDLARRIDGLESRFTNLEHKFDLRFDMLLGKIEDIDNRLTRLASHRGR